MTSHTIQSLNDRFRRGDPSLAGQILITQGIQSLAPERTALVALIQRVRCFEDFSPENDPYGEHDFGAFEFEGTTCFWKIDIYDLDYQTAPLDAEDPTCSRRVLTIMTAAEY